MGETYGYGVWAEPDGPWLLTTDAHGGAQRYVCHSLPEAEAVAADWTRSGHGRFTAKPMPDDCPCGDCVTRRAAAVGE